VWPGGSQCHKSSGRHASALSGHERSKTELGHPLSTGHATWLGRPTLRCPVRPHHAKEVASLRLATQSKMPSLLLPQREHGINSSRAMRREKPRQKSDPEERRANREIVGRCESLDSI